MAQRYEQEGGPKNPGTPGIEVFIPLKAVKAIIGQEPLLDSQKRNLLGKVTKLQEGDSRTGVIFDPQTLSKIEESLHIPEKQVAAWTIDERIRNVAEMVKLQMDGNEEFLSGIERDLGLDDESKKKHYHERRPIIYEKLEELIDKAKEAEELKKEAQKSDTESVKITIAVRIVLDLTNTRWADLSPLEQRRITGDLEAHGIESFDPDKI